MQSLARFIALLAAVVAGLGVLAAWAQGIAAMEGVAEVVGLVAFVVVASVIFFLAPGSSIPAPYKLLVASSCALLAAVVIGGYAWYTAIGTDDAQQWAFTASGYAIVAGGALFGGFHVLVLFASNEHAPHQ